MLTVGSKHNVPEVQSHILLTNAEAELGSNFKPLKVHQSATELFFPLLKDANMMLCCLSESSVSKSYAETIFEPSPYSELLNMFLIRDEQVERTKSIYVFFMETDITIHYDGMPSAHHQGNQLYPAFSLMLLELQGKKLSHQIVGCKLADIALIIMLLQSEE